MNYHADKATAAGEDAALPTSTLAAAAARIVAGLGLESEAATAAVSAIEELTTAAAQAAISKARYELHTRNQRNELSLFANQPDYLHIKQILGTLDGLRLPITLPYVPGSFG